MAHRDQFGGALGGGDSGEARHFKRVAFWVLWQRFQDLGRHLDEGAGLGFALVGGLGGDVDHGGAAGFVVVGEFGHRQDSTVPSTQYPVPSTQYPVPRKDYIMGTCITQLSDGETTSHRFILGPWRRIESPFAKLPRLIPLLVPLVNRAF